MQAQALLRKSIRDTTAELEDEDEEDPDRKHKDEEDSDAPGTKAKPSRGRGKGRGRGRGRKKAEKHDVGEPKSSTAEQELNNLPKKRHLAEQPQPADHVLPTDLEHAAESAEEKAKHDVKDQASAEEGEPDQEQQTATPSKKKTKS